MALAPPPSILRNLIRADINTGEPLAIVAGKMSAEMVMNVCRPNRNIILKSDVESFL